MKRTGLEWFVLGVAVAAILPMAIFFYSLIVNDNKGTFWVWIAGLMAATSGILIVTKLAPMWEKQVKAS